MGISGLLPFLEKATKPCHISEFRGTTVVVDTYCWLHKAATAVSFHSSDNDNHTYVNYCVKYIKLLRSHDIRPILVFDGKNLPAKSETELKRRESRVKAKHRAAELLRLGKTEEAKSYLKQSINITPEIASAVIKECHKMNIDCIVAPYESDAQLAYFNIKGIAELVITEDSDLMLFGCTRVIYKLDMQGCGYLVEADKLHLATKIRPDSYTFDKFRYMCILSGCDYVDSLPGIGLKKAEKFFALTEETNPLIFLDKVPRYLNMRHLQISEEYKEKFMIADATFRHQTVFDPFKKRLVPLTEPEVCGTNPKYCKNAGEIFSHDIAYQVALGNLHPTKHSELNSWSPTKAGVSNSSIWSGVYKKIIPRKEHLFTSTPKNKPKFEHKIEILDYEKLKAEEDQKIEEELQVYCRKSTDKSACRIDIDESNKESPPENNVETSPVLKRNPFIKRLSKFKSTSSIEKGIIVKSRFFCQPAEDSAKIDKTVCADQQNNELKTVEIVSPESISHSIIECREETDSIKLNESIDVFKTEPFIKDVIDLNVEDTHTEEEKICVNRPESSISQKVCIHFYNIIQR
nr:exonuclease 1 [Leptinotarsa decemlineata]